MLSRGLMIHEDGRIGLVVIDESKKPNPENAEESQLCNHCDSDCCKQYGRCDKGGVAS